MFCGYFFFKVYCREEAEKIGINQKQNLKNVNVFFCLSDQNVHILQNVFTGLAAVAGFLVVVFVVITSHKLLKRKRKDKK